MMLFHQHFQKKYIVHFCVLYYIGGAVVNVYIFKKGKSAPIWEYWIDKKHVYM